jgi:hypothetical protein
MACQLTPDAPKGDGLVTCAAWLETTNAERFDVADVLVGDSRELLDKIRVRQHQPPGTPRRHDPRHSFQPDEGLRNLAAEDAAGS